MSCPDSVLVRIVQIVMIDSPEFIYDSRQGHHIYLITTMCIQINREVFKLLRGIFLLSVFSCIFRTKCKTKINTVRISFCRFTASDRPVCGKLRKIMRQIICQTEFIIFQIIDEFLLIINLFKIRIYDITFMKPDVICSTYHPAVPCKILFRLFLTSGQSSDNRS